MVPFQPFRALTALIIIVVVVIITKQSYTAIKYKLDNTRSLPGELSLSEGWTCELDPSGETEEAQCFQSNFPSQFLPCAAGRCVRTRDTAPSRQHQPHSVLLQQWDNPCSARPRLKEFGLLATRASW